MLNKDIAIRLVRNQRDGGAKLNWALLPTTNKVKDISFIRKFRETESFHKGSFALKDDMLHKAIVSVIPGAWKSAQWQDVSGYVAYIEGHNEDTAYPADSIIVDDDDNLWYSPTALSPGPFVNQAWVLYRPEMNLLTASAYLDPLSLIEKAKTVSCRLVDIEAEDSDPLANCDFYFDPDLIATLFQDTAGLVPVTKVGQEVKCIKPVGETDATNAIVWQSGDVGKLAECPNGIGYITRGADSVYHANSSGATYQVVVPGIGTITMTGLSGQFPVTFGKNEQVLMGQAAVHSVHSGSAVSNMETELSRSANRYDVKSIVNLDNFFKDHSGEITGIEKWYTGNVTSMRGTFSNAVNFPSDLSAWDVSSVLTFKDCFNTCPIDVMVGNWNVHSVLSFEGMFANTTSFNQDISSWNAPLCLTASDMFKNAQVFDQDMTGMKLEECRSTAGMFEGSVAFNQPVGGIVFGKLENVSGMFKNAQAYNQELTAFDVSTVTNFTGMFEGSVVFDKEIGPLDTSSGIIFTGFFKNAAAYNQPIITNSFENAVDFTEFFYGTALFDSTVSAFGTCTVLENVTSMFEDAVMFNQEITSFNTSTVTTFTAMFKGADTFNRPLNIIDTSSALTTASMFENAVSFDQDLANFVTSTVTDMSSMFSGAMAFDGDVTTFDTSAVTNFDLCFKDALVFNQDISNWNVSAATTMTEMFHEATAFDKDLLRWCVSSVTSEQADFSTNSLISNMPLWGRCPSGAIASTAMLGSYDPTIKLSLFKDAALTVPVTAVGDEVKGIHDLSGLNNHLVSSGMTHPTYQEDSSGTGYLILPAGASLACTSITSEIEIQAVVPAVGIVELYRSPGIASYWGKDTATTLGPIAITVAGDTVNLKGANANIYAAGTTTSIASMFEVEFFFNGDLSSWDTSYITDMSNLFRGAPNFNQPLTGWDLSGVTKVEGMFSYARNFNQDLSGLTFNTGITSMSKMFAGAESFNQDLSGLPTDSVTDMSYMFENAFSFDSPLSDPATGFGQVLNFEGMLSGASAYNQDLSTMVLNGNASMDKMLKNTFSFDQDISGWCVSGKTEEPTEFMDGSNATFVSATAKHPVWGQAC